MVLLAEAGPYVAAGSAIIVALISAGGLVYIALRQSKTDRKAKDALDGADMATLAFDSLKKSVDDCNTRCDQLRTENDDLREDIRKKDRKIDDMGREMSDMKRKISILEAGLKT